MEIVGRITKNAVVNQLKDERKVVNFSIAVNDYYKSKNSMERVKTTTFINCAYWISTKIAEKLTKGTLAEISGRLYLNVYNGADGEAKASLNCHVNSIKIHAFGNSGKLSEKETDSIKDSLTKEENPSDDLPF